MKGIGLLRPRAKVSMSFRDPDIGTPYVDVLLPVYNAADTLAASLSSIAAQTFTNFRVLAVDDGSTDASPDILADWAARDKRFKIVRRPNAGIVTALNVGLALAAAPFIARMDADDISLPERFDVQLAYLRNTSGCVAVGCGILHIDSRGHMLPGLPVPGPPADADANWLPAREPYIMHPFLMVRRSAMIDVGGYRHVPGSEDSDLYWRLSEKGALHNLPEILGYYRMHDLSISGASIEGGRVMAVGSQLGALSARRRRSGLADLAFDSDLATALRSARSLDAMCEMLALTVAAEEMPFFRLSVGLKLLELAAYRPFEIDRDDCRFLRNASKRVNILDRAISLDVRWRFTDTGRVLLRNGHWGDAAALLPLRFVPRTVVKAVRPGNKLVR